MKERKEKVVTKKNCEEEKWFVLKMNSCDVNEMPECFQMFYYNNHVNLWSVEHPPLSPLAALVCVHCAVWIVGSLFSSSSSFSTEWDWLIVYWNWKQSCEVYEFFFRECQRTQKCRKKRMRHFIQIQSGFLVSFHFCSHVLLLFSFCHSFGVVCLIWKILSCANQAIS